MDSKEKVFANELTKREYFAAAALQCFEVTLGIAKPDYDLVAIRAVELADALIFRLAQHKPNY